MRLELRERIRALGRELTPELIEGTHRLFAELHAEAGNGERGGGAGASRVMRDQSYGPDERNRLDLWLPAAERAAGAGRDAERGRNSERGRNDERSARTGRPTLLFVHGGGFVRGDKCIPGLPFYDNIGRWAAARGFIGATMTYRLAPEHAWPAGAEDVGRAVEWLAQHVAAYGGDPGKIFAMGQSAGAVHVATYVAFPRFHGPAGVRLAGALLASGLYDIERADRNEFQKAYFGADESRYAERSSLAGLVRTSVPILASVSEFDADDFYRQAALFVSEFTNTRKRYPRMLYLSGHNHLSSVHQIGLTDDSLGPEIASFIEAVTTASAE